MPRSTGLSDQAADHIRQRRWDIVVTVVLLAFGIYQSVIYFGHQQAGTVDFFEFAASGEKLLSLQLPDTFKRAPVLGILQVGLGRILGGQYPSLNGAWALNAILHPCSLILLWLIGRRLLGRAGVCFAVIAILNPMQMKLLGMPLAETTLIFFILLTLYLILRRSRWCYLCAAITTMVRYEGAALIMIAFVMDLIHGPTNRQRLRALLWAALASLPLGLWLLGTHLTWQPGSSHYLTHYGRSTILGKFVGNIWKLTFSPLLNLPSQRLLTAAAQAAAWVGVVFGAMYGLIYGIYKRRYYVLALLLFLAPYFLVHVLKSRTVERYSTPISWLVLLLCWYGWQNIGKLITAKIKVPRALAIALQLFVCLGAFFWLAHLAGDLDKTIRISRPSANLPYVAWAAVAVILLAWALIYKARGSLAWAALSAVLCLMIAANHVQLAVRVGNGEKYLEFRQLAQWYVKYADHEGKLACYRPQFLRFFAHEYRDNFRGFANLRTADLSDFVHDCRQQNVRYVAWLYYTGRIKPNSSRCRLPGIRNFAMIMNPRSVGPLEFVKQFDVAHRRILNIYRVPKAGESE